MTTTHASIPEVAEDADGKGLMNVAIFGATGQLGRHVTEQALACLLYTSPSPRDRQKSRMPSSA